jgi:hypothetical protein
MRSRVRFAAFALLVALTIAPAFARTPAFAPAPLLGITLLLAWWTMRQDADIRRLRIATDAGTRTTHPKA